MKPLCVILLLFLFQESSCPVQIDRFTIIVSQRAFRREPTKLTADIKNLDSSRRIKSIEFQFDVMDSMRRVAKERLFVTVTDYGLGDRTIDVGRSRRWTAELGDTRFPAGCDAYGTLSNSKMAACGNAKAGAMSQTRINPNSLLPRPSLKMPASILQSHVPNLRLSECLIYQTFYLH
jgi:hypothetical protein